ncbi:COG4 transport protein,putative [Schistosoma mansoni]|uniref:COG4 transport protein,putative n=1 Tax=Schistosoma mansoni TaxID=6183 RepID=UPI00022C8443|nr:COG4 transport protein,putative [Schistosoma mansoni]|eukprot:XP_018644452.1 COG4 transport protein,putative [Schistosoma mansoni]
MNNHINVKILNKEIHNFEKSVGCQLSSLSVMCSGARLVGPGFESREAGPWMRTAEESHNRTKWPSSASRFSMVV